MNLTLTRGDSKTFDIPLNRTPATNAGLIFTLKSALTDADSSAKVQKTSGAGISLSGSTASVSLVHIDTKTLTDTQLYWDIQVQEQTGEVWTGNSGYLFLNHDATRELSSSITIYTSQPAVAGAAADASLTTRISTEESTRASADASITSRLPSSTVAVPAGAIDFSTSSPVTAFQVARMRWNDTDRCVEYDSSEAGTTIQLGQEVTVRARNQTGSPIANGTAVYIDGATGDRPRIVPANADTLTHANNLIGLVTSSDGIANGTDGHVTVFGLVRGLNTQAFNAGDVLYLATSAGGWTATKPTGTNYVTRVGFVVRANTNDGVILVAPQFYGSALNEAFENATTAAAARAVIGILSGTGSPEGAVTAAVGTLYTRTDGGVGSTFYVKESGTGNIGWAAK